MDMPASSSYAVRQYIDEMVSYMVRLLLRFSDQSPANRVFPS